MRSVSVLAWGCAVAFALSPVIVSGAESASVQSVQGLDPSALSLAEAVKLALARSPESRVASARVEAAAARALQSRRLPNPELELGVDDWPAKGGHSYADSKRTVGISQTLPFPGKRRLDKQIGGAGVKLSEAEQAEQRGALVREVSIAYFRVLAAERSLGVARDLVQVADSSAAVSRKRVDAGGAPLQEQLRAELQAEQSHLQLEDYKAELVAARQDFAVLLGDMSLSEVRLSSSLQEESVEALLAGDPAERVAGHARLLAAQQELERAELLVRRSRLESYSDLKVAVAGGRAGAGDESIVQLSVSVPLPLFDRGKGHQQEARANVSVARAQKEALRLRLIEAWNVAAQRYRSAILQVAKYRESILPKADEARRLVERGFEQGKFGFIDLLDTQRSTAELRLAYQQKLFELNRAQAELEALSSRADKS